MGNPRSKYQSIEERFRKIWLAYFLLILLVLVINILVLASIMY
jgi:hypothetical protein